MAVDDGDGDGDADEDEVGVTCGLPPPPLQADTNAATSAKAEERRARFTLPPYEETAETLLHDSIRLSVMLR